MEIGCWEGYNNIMEASRLGFSGNKMTGRQSGVSLSTQGVVKPTLLILKGWWRQDVSLHTILNPFNCIVYTTDYFTLHITTQHENELDTNVATCC